MNICFKKVIGIVVALTILDMPNKYPNSFNFFRLLCLHSFPCQ